MSLVTLCNVCNSVSIDYKAADRGRCAAQREGGETPPLPEPGRPRPPELSSANQKTRRLASANQSPAPLYSPTPLYFILTTLWLDIFFLPAITYHQISIMNSNSKHFFVWVSSYKVLLMNFLLKFSGKRFFVNKMHLIVWHFVKVAFRMQFSCENKIRTCAEPGLRWWPDYPCWLVSRLWRDY